MKGISQYGLHCSYLSRAVCWVALVACFASADEWRARHELVSPTGILNLPSVPQPEDSFVFGPASPADFEAWYAALKAWRSDRVSRLRYVGSEYRRPEL